MQSQKRILSAVAYGVSLLMPIFAHAGDISLYGVADVYGEYGKGNKQEVSINSGGVSGSRLGFTATQPIDGSLKALVTLEAGYAIDNGNSTQNKTLFGRQAFVGVTGSMGSLTIGRQYTPQFLALDANDPFDTGAGSAISSGVVSLLASRADNSVVWDSANLGSVHFTLMLAPGESSTGSTLNNSLFEGNLHLGAGPAGVDLTASELRRSTNDGTNAVAISLGGFYDFGAFKLLGGAQVVNHSSRTAGATDKRQEFFGGINAPIGGGTLWLGAGTGKTQGVAGSTASQYSVGYIHPLGKGFDMYGVLTTVKNGSATAYSTDTATGSGPVVDAGVNASAAQVGMRYRF